MFNEHLTYNRFWEIKEAIAHAFSRNDLDFEDHDIEIAFSNRMTSSLGMAWGFSPDNPYQYRIRFSRKLWSRASPRERYETAVHEACHIIDFIKNPSRKSKLQGHDYPWRIFMARAGVKPERYHNVPCKDLHRQNRKVEVLCGCGVRQITKNRATRMKNGKKYICLKCNVVIKAKEI